MIFASHILISLSNKSAISLRAAAASFSLSASTSRKGTSCAARERAKEGSVWRCCVKDEEKVTKEKVTTEKERKHR